MYKIKRFNDDSKEKMSRAELAGNITGMVGGATAAGAGLLAQNRLNKVVDKISAKTGAKATEIAPGLTTWTGKNADKAARLHQITGRKILRKAKAAQIAGLGLSATGLGTAAAIRAKRNKKEDK